MTSLAIVVSSGTLGAVTPAGESVSVSFQNTEVVFDQVTFSPDCVPVVYRLIFNGPVGLLSTAGSPIAASLEELVMRAASS